MVRFALHFFAIVTLTLLSMFGGLAWFAALFAKRKVLVFVGSYAAMSVAAYFVAPYFGRVPLSCMSDANAQIQSPIYCLLNRNFVDPLLADALVDLGDHVENSHPGTVTHILDANFPFFDGFPLLPHLSHNDGKKVDLGFYYQKDAEYLAIQRSPIGYFAFEDGPSQCESRFPTLRWNLEWLQPHMKSLELDEPRLKTALEWLATDDRIGKVLLEPHLKQRLELNSDKIRFQGCRAARHDDHIHIQL